MKHDTRTVLPFKGNKWIVISNRLGIYTSSSINVLVFISRFYIVVLVVVVTLVLVLVLLLFLAVQVLLDQIIVI